MGFDLETEDFAAQLEAAASSGDVKKVIDLERSKKGDSLAQWVQQCRTLRVDRDEFLSERQALTKESDALEAEHKLRAKAYADLITLADDARIALNRVEVRQFANDQRLETLRQNINELNRELRETVSNRIEGMNENRHIENERR